jgi:hypothetical protein
VVAAVAVALLVIGGVGGFVLGRTTDHHPTDHRPGIGDSRHLPPGFDGRGRPDFPGGPGDRNGPGGRDGGRGTGT